MFMFLTAGHVIWHRSAYYCGIEQVFEERAVMDHRLAEILGGCFAASLADGDLVRRAIVLDDVRVIHGHVRGALLEIADGIATNLHEIRDEAVCFDHGTFRVIDEPRLIRTPLLREPRAVLGAERFQVQLLHALDTIIELAFRVSRVAAFPHEPFVLRTEFPAKLVGAALLRQYDGDDYHRQRDQHTNDYSGVE